MRIRDYRFVITIMWFAFIVALAFIETPLRFAADGITRVNALSIGHLVFHALNYCELVFAALLVIGEFSCRLQVSTEIDESSLGEPAKAISGYNPLRHGRTSKWARRLILLATGILLIQTILLFTVLDTRTLAIINGQEVGESMYHSIYIGLEIVKLTTLVSLGTMQIKNFKNQCCSIVRY